MLNVVRHTVDSEMCELCKLAFWLAHLERPMTSSFGSCSSSSGTRLAQLSVRVQIVFDVTMK